MGTLYSRRGSSYYVTSTQDQDLSQALPALTFVADWDAKAGEFFLRVVDDFVLPDTIYGDLEAKAARVLSTFEDRPESTGVLLAGEKGSGKSLLAKIICYRAAARDVPTILVNTPFGGDRFNRFVQSIHQPAVFLFDEFEKVYPPGEVSSHRDDDDDPIARPDGKLVTQEVLLTLLDGTFPTRKLFLLTCNNRYKIDRNLINRPGRLFYFLEFSGVSAEFVAEYCRARLRDPSHLPAVQRLSAVLGGFNFDQLQAVVEEINRYGEAPDKALGMLNIKPDRGQAYFDIHLERNGRVVAAQGEQIYLNPYREAAKVQLKSGGPDGQDRHVTFQPADLVTVDPAGGRYVYERDGYALTLTEPVRREFAMRTLLG